MPPAARVLSPGMHPSDTEDRLAYLKIDYGLGYCNITKCCTKVRPEHITITDNAIIRSRNGWWMNSMTRSRSCLGCSSRTRNERETVTGS